jgi:hypothetical protein
MPWLNFTRKRANLSLSFDFCNVSPPFGATLSCYVAQGLQYRDKVHKNTSQSRNSELSQYLSQSGILHHVVGQQIADIPICTCENGQFTALERDALLPSVLDQALRG